MSQFHSISRLLSARAEEFCQTYLSAGHRSGHEWLVGDALGTAGDSLTVQLEGPKQGLWYDHADTGGGDLLKILELQFGSNIKAADEARKFLGLQPWRPHANGPTNGDTFDPLKFSFTRKGETEKRYPAAAWPYHDDQGHVIGYACRFNFPDGKKDVLPLRHTDEGWRWRGWSGDEKRPLYGLHRLKQRPDAPVLIVEGEKTCDAATKLFPDYVCVTWQGGSKASEKADLSPLLSRSSRIVLWPDADKPGRAAMEYLKARLPRSVSVVLPGGIREGWDLADPIPEGVSIRGLIDAALDPAALPEPQALPFRLLGYHAQVYYYLGIGNDIVSMEPCGHTEMNFQQLAGDDFWLPNFPPLRGDLSPNYKAAAKYLIAAQHRHGRYNEAKARGAGCWIDEGRVIYHAGDRLYIEGKEVPLTAYNGRFIYPASEIIVTLDLSNPLSIAEVAPFLRLSESFRWRHHDFWWFLPGQIACAIVCGALDWRPHFWLTGRAGTGKSWMFSDVIVPLLGRDGILLVQSSTTEAGIRQSIARNAIAVVMDEAESKDLRSMARIQLVLELMRQASSESGGAIIKGSTSGKAQSYLVRSSFMFASIGLGASEPADESRIARMELEKPIPEAFAEINALCATTVRSPLFCSRFRARVIGMAPIIRQSAVIYSEVIARVTGDSRTGQQYGALCAGYYALISDSPITHADAYEWAGGIDWNSLRSDAGGDDDDSSRCLDVLLQAKIDLQESDGVRFSLTVGELLHRTFTFPEEHKKHADAYDALMRIGIHPIGDSFDIAMKHTALDRIFHGSQYYQRHRDHLERIPGAKTGFYTPTGGKTTRSVRIHRDSVDDLRRAEV